MAPDEIAHYRTDLLAFSERIFEARKGSPLKRNWHQDEICRHLERVVIGDIRRLIINIPPRSGKTEFAVRCFIAWCMGNWPHSEFIHASYAKRLAAANTYAVRAIMQHEVYREIFDHTELMVDSKARDEFRTAQGGIVYATGNEGTITGYGAGSISEEFGGAIVIDDPAKPDEAESDVIREGVLEWFQNTIESRKNHPDTPIIIIAQRLHERDLPGWLLDGGNGEHWDLLKIPARADDGTSFWPEQFPPAMLDRLEAANPYVFAGQYQQEPAPRSGGAFQPSAIEIVDALPAGLRFVRGWDLAATKDAGDWTACVLLAVDGDGRTWIAHADRIRGGPDAVERMLVNTAKADGPSVRQSIPQDPGQAGVAQKAYLSRKLAGCTFEFSVESGDKATRASPVAAQVNVGNVRMLRGPWVEWLRHEMRAFPKGANDDGIDALARAYNTATRGRAGVMIGRA